MASRPPATLPSCALGNSGVLDSTRDQRASSSWSAAKVEELLCCLAWKKVCKDRKKPVIGQQPGTKSADGSVGEALINRLSCSSIRFTYDFVCSYFRKDGKTVLVILHTEMVDCPLGASLCLSLPRLALPRPALPRPAPPGPASPRRLAMPSPSRSEPPCPLYVRVLHSTGLIALRPAWEQMSCSLDIFTLSCLVFAPLLWFARCFHSTWTINTFSPISHGAA